MAALTSSSCAKAPARPRRRNGHAALLVLLAAAAVALALAHAPLQAAASVSGSRRAPIAPIARHRQMLARKRRPGPAPAPAPEPIPEPAPESAALPASAAAHAHAHDPLKLALAGATRLPLDKGRYAPVLAPSGRPLSRVAFSDVQPAGLHLGFNLTRVAERAMGMSAHSWEYGTVAEMLLEVYDGPSSVFGSNSSDAAFPFGQVPQLDPDTSPSLAYARQHIVRSGTARQLIAGDGSSGDPASLGVAATMLGAAGLAGYQAAAARQLTHLLTGVPRWPNGAISHRQDYAAVWADFMSMAPPFIAYQAVAQNRTELMRTAVQQCRDYHDALATSPQSPAGGAWMHILGPQAQSKGIWSTGNAWALLGLVRVLATMQNWGPTSGADFADARTELSGYVYEMLSAVQQLSGLGAGSAATASGLAPPPVQSVALDARSGLLRGYLIGGYRGLGDARATWPGEITGSAGIAAAIYRMAVLDPPAAALYVGMADALRAAVAKAVDPHTGIAAPAMNPLAWWDPTPTDEGSPEGQALVAMMGAAYRECVGAAVCQPAAASSS